MTVVQEKVLARLACSPARRVLAAIFLALPGAILIWIAASSAEGSAVVRALSAALGAAALWGAWRVWGATMGEIVLTEAGLFDQTGRLLCPIGEIERVESGILAFKPSGGFMLRLARPAPPGWVPGLWWRRGRRMGVGGSVNARQAKAMAETIAVMVLRREQGEET